MLHIAKPIIAVLLTVTVAHGQVSFEKQGDERRLEYQKDEQGNRIPDFSHCGYRGADTGIPQVRSAMVVRPSGQDDTQRIQTAIDFVSQLPTDKDGSRGAVLLSRGEFKVSGQLRIHTSGVVVRGHGAGEGGTTLRATGRDRRSVIRVLPRKKDDPAETRGADERTYQILDDYVPVGAKTVTLNSIEGVSVGKRVEVTHPSSTAWIDKLGIDLLGWREGTRGVRWSRAITAVERNVITLDAPLTLAIDKTLCQGTVRTVDTAWRLREVGIEDLAIVSDFDEQNPKDEQHAWYGVHMQGVRDAWVSRVQFRHLAGGAVMLGDQTSRITVSDCASFAPVSEIGGYRRHTFLTLGQQCLFLRCWSEQGLHDFCVGYCSAGPNAFVSCYAKDALGDSGPRESCATGVLYDNVRIEGHDLNLMNRWNVPPKTGWAAINCLLWQCQAANVRCDNPPVGANWAIGLWATPSGDGHISNVSDFVNPISLYQRQIKERVGDEAEKRVGPFLLKPVGATNPKVEQAKEFTEESLKPVRQLIDLVRDNWQKSPISIDSVRRLEDVELPSQDSRARRPSSRMAINNGWLTSNGKLITGDYYTPTWWRGDLQRERAKAMGPAITRFTPARHGTGLTDDLEVVAARMERDNLLGYDHHYGLWYDRRRDDHLMVRRADGEVVPPFYEQPFARSGKGTAWDGLSRYDLTKSNPWYWNRLRDFATLGEQHGFVLFHHNYFQHNILEAGAHWADSPWRPANNVNATGLPEPPPYVGDKRIFLAEQFYDVSNVRLRDLHQPYIRQCLNNFVGQHNVIQLTSGELTGPLSFVQFWIDTIVDWEAETGQDAIVALSCTKDVQDAILADAKRSPHVEVIDIRYWTYTENGELYAPLGGQHLSPRQHARQLKPASTSFASIVRSIREYREKYPNKAVTYNAHIHCRAKREGWAILIGGGSMPNVPPLPDELAKVVCRTSPSENSMKLEEGQWCLAGNGWYLIYSNRERPSEIDSSNLIGHEWVEVDSSTGKQLGDWVSVEQRMLPIPAGRHVVWARPCSKNNQ